MTYDTETEGKRQVIFYLCYSSLLYTISEGSQQFATAEIGTVGIDDGFRLLQVEFVLLIHIFFIGMYCHHIRQEHIMGSQRQDLSHSFIIGAFTSDAGMGVSPISLNLSTSRPLFTPQ